MRRYARELTLLAGAAASVVAAVLVYHAVLGGPGGPTWSAEFVNARGLIAGNDVRDDGAVVGRVTAISLARTGDALVRFRLFDRAAAPRADAVAGIEAADLLGDNYLSLSPGNAPRPLRGPIPPSRTVDAPRLDELLDAFTPGVRDGLQTLLVEGGLALEDRGGALSQATVALRPALTAAGSLLNEVNAQNGVLARLVPTAARAAAQLEAHRGDIGPLLASLSQTLRGTAEATGALGSGISALPATLARLRATAGQIGGLSVAATPLAEELGRAAAPLGAVVKGVPNLVREVRLGSPAYQHALETARSAVVAGAPALGELATAFPTLQRQAPSIATLLGELDAAAPGISQGFFVDFPDEADESGRQPFDPFAEATRNYWRGAAVLSCEAFGVPVAPGCLTAAIAGLTKQPEVKLGSTPALLRYLLAR